MKREGTQKCDMRISWRVRLKKGLRGGYSFDVERNMKNKFLTLVFIITLLTSAVAVAATEIRSTDEVAGSWSLESSGANPDQGQLSRDETWVFEGGKLIKIGLKLPRGKTYDTPPVDYKVENGKLLVGVVGRPGKYSSYTFTELSGGRMTLKERNGGYLFFKK